MPGAVRACRQSAGEYIANVEAQVLEHEPLRKPQDKRVHRPVEVLDFDPGRQFGGGHSPAQSLRHVVDRNVLIGDLVGDLLRRDRRRRDEVMGALTAG